MSILDSITGCVWFSEGGHKRGIASMVSGIMFFLAWWLMIDAISVSTESIGFSFHICGILGTLSLFMVNSVTNEQMENTAIRTWLFVGFVLGFASVIAAVWIMVVFFQEDEVKGKWPGYALLLQNILILLASLIYKFGRTNEDVY